MSEGDGQSICGIGGRSFRKTKQSPNHESDLCFIRSPLSDHGHFDFFGRVFVNGNAVIRCRNHGGGTGGAHGNRGAVGLDVDNALDRDFVRLMFLDDVNEMRADGGERAGLQDIFRNGNHIIAEHRWLPRIAFEDGIARVTDGGIYGEDAHAVT